MALVNRLSRLFQADFHAMLDRIEEPDIQLKQAVREMQMALDDDEQCLSLLRHDLDRLEKQDAEIPAQLDQLNEELDICLAADKESLARDLVQRKLIAQKQQQFLAKQIATLLSKLKSDEQRLTQQRLQLDSMKQKLELFVKQASPYADNKNSSAYAVREEEIDIALLREKQRRIQS